MVLQRNRRRVTYVLRRMKEANAKNPTPQKITDDLKAEEEHNKGLRHFLTAVLKKVAKQMEDLNSFRRSNLKSFLTGPAKGETDKKNKGKRDRSEAPKENVDQT